MVNYQVYLNSIHWTNKRANSRKARGFRFGCLACGNKHFDVHHLDYKELGREKINKHLIPLCREHHNEFHEWQTKNKASVGDVLTWLSVYYKSSHLRLDKHVKGKLKKYSSAEIKSKKQNRKRKSVVLLDEISRIKEEFIILSKKQRKRMPIPSNLLFDNLGIPDGSFEQRMALYINNPISKLKILNLLSNFGKFSKEYLLYKESKLRTYDEFKSLV